jgi:GPH family glycoside/pentoside/hexuronide:cation symporter
MLSVSTASGLAPAATPVRELTLRRQLGWAVGDTGINFYWGMLNTFLFFFYTDILGISPVWAGFAFAIASVWDGLTDPIMGAIVDRTNSRHGRFRPYLLYLSVPTGLSFILMFWAPPLEGAWLTGFAVVTHVLFRTLMTGLGVPFSSLSAVITQDSNRRNWLASFRIIFAAIGGLSVAFTVSKFLELFEDQKLAFLLAASILAVFATIIMLIVFFSTRGMEGPMPAPVRTERGQLVATFLEDAKSFWRILLLNTPLALLFASVTVSSVMGNMRDKAQIYWLKYDLGDLSVMGWLLPLGAVVVIVASPLWAKAGQYFSKRVITLCGAAMIFVSSGLFYVFNPHNHLLLAAISALSAAGIAAKYVMYWSMLPDTVEYNELVTGSRSDAKIFGFAALAQKVSLAVNAIIFGYLLDATGFVADQPQNEATKQAILAIMCFVPMVSVIISSTLIWFYPIDAKFHAGLRSKIAARAAANA